MQRTGRLWAAAACLSLLAAPAPAQAGSIIPPAWADRDSNPCSSQSWQLVVWPEDGQCYPIYQRGPCSVTMELVWNEARGRAVCACPSGHLHHGETGRCYRRHSRGPCPPRHYFSPGQDDRPATCRPFSECAPGEIFWPRDGGCHPYLTQGPCGHGELIYLNPLTLEPECGCHRRLMARSYWVHTDSCYQEYTRGPCPHGLIFVFNSTRGGSQCDCHPLMLENYHPPSGQCYPTNSRGPCPLGNTFAYNNVTRTTECRCEDEGLIWPDTGECYRQFTQGPCELRHFLVPQPEAPEQGMCLANPCGRGELYFPSEGSRCYRIGRQGPCDLGTLVQYEEYRGISYRGACGCSRHFTQNFWQGDGRCYQQRTQGPCTAPYTFAFNRTAGATECVCDERQGRVRFPAAGGECFQLQKRGPCPVDQVLTRSLVGGSGEEQKQSVLKCRCRPGTYLDQRLRTCLPRIRQVFNKFDIMRILR